MNKNKEIEFYKLLESFKDTKRYGEYDKRFHESSASHTCLLSLFVIDIYRQYNVNIDLCHALEIANVHDLSEIGLDFDFDAKSCHNNLALSQKKKNYEQNILNTFSLKYKKTYIQKLCDEYNNAQTKEAIFVKALDKLEAVLHIFYRGAISLTDVDFAINNFEKYITPFPELLPILTAIRGYKISHWKI